MKRLRMKEAVALLMVLLGLAGSVEAAPITYAITFTPASGIAPTSGSFTYDSVADGASAFSNFLVVWNGLTFDLTSSANAPANFSNGCDTQAGGPNNGHKTFDVLFDGTPDCGGTLDWHATTGVTLASFVFRDNADTPQDPGMLISTTIAIPASGRGTGTWAVAPSAVPEPASVWLMLSGGIGLFVRARRRYTS